MVWNVEYTGTTASFCPVDNGQYFDGYPSHNPPDGTTWTACR